MRAVLAKGAATNVVSGGRPRKVEGKMRSYVATNRFMYTMGTKKKERWVLNPNDLYEVDTAQVRIGYPSFSFFCSHSVHEPPAHR
jgi:hypothetical protein